MTLAYSFGSQGRGIMNPFSSFAIEFGYTSNDALIYIYFDKNITQKTKKTLLVTHGVLVDANLPMVSILK